jgi:hypothetical protein
MFDLQRKRNSVKKIAQIVLFISIIFSFSNCIEETAVIIKEPSFFDLKGYFKAQLEILSDNEKVKKSTSIDGKSIEKILDSIDFNEELKAFEDSDINKIAWVDKYQVDSLYDEKGMLDKVNYQATDEKLRTQQLLISFNQNKVDTVDIFNNSTSSIASLKQHLRYIPSYGYSIKSTQKTTLFEEHVLAVDVQFLK